ncbi:uncharacterized protein LOC128034825 [Gossypium raimondii]|uniref:uncharacterized protein LOC128034825 n=1 Tax=Gossypium raimondii TaxID=29730 RepID=UPI00227D4739|nr:uncharacterized protein LOC128034825 [Gossypium raimondii]
MTARGTRGRGIRRGGRYRDRERGKNTRDLEPSSSFLKPKKRARPNGPIRAGVPITPTGIQPCGDCGIGSTHFYVASTIFENLGISVECTSGEITVLTSLGQPVRVKKLYRNVPLEVQGTIFLANLMELAFGEFDLTLGMDWLVEHRVSLDYVTRRAVLRTKDDTEVVVIGELRDYLSTVISVLVANKLVRKGCEVYLAYVSVSVFEDSFVGDIKIVREFLDVFSEELSGLPLNQEVEFGIKLLPGTAPVSIAPYRMAPKELIKLKVELQELLDCGFIRPSVSP